MRGVSIFLLLAGLAPQGAAQVLDPQNMIVENVYIAASDAVDVLANLLIRDNKLELLSKDVIPIPDGFVAVDANGGFLLGNLTLGASPSFMILETDPRIDFEVLLNIEAHSGLRRTRW